MYKICDNKNMLKYVITIKNFLIVICEKKECWMQLGSRVAVIPLPAASPGKSPAGGPGKFVFYCSKGRRLAYYLFTFHIKCIAVWWIFV